MDNAAFHKSSRTKELIESVGCTILYQPPYSPDLNPIEKQWAILKRKFKKYKHLFDNFNDAVDYAFVAWLFRGFTINLEWLWYYNGRNATTAADK